MAKQLEDFPADIRENLLDGAQQVFLAAYNSATRDGMGEEAAMQVAWNTIRHDYEQGEDGKWRMRSGDVGVHNKPIVSGGN